MDIRDEIIKSIEVMIDKSLEDQKNTTTKPAIVESINNDKYQVSLNGTTISVYDSVGCDPTIGAGVWVQIPNGDIKNAFITGLRANAEGGGGSPIRYQSDWLETNPNSPSYIRNKLNNIYFTPSAIRENIQSGESFSVLFGKIAKYLGDLKYLAYKENVEVSDITDFDETMERLLSVPITNEMIHSLFE